MNGYYSILYIGDDFICRKKLPHIFRVRYCICKDLTQANLCLCDLTKLL